MIADMWLAVSSLAGSPLLQFLAAIGVAVGLAYALLPARRS